MRAFSLSLEVVVLVDSSKREVAKARASDGRESVTRQQLDVIENVVMHKTRINDGAKSKERMPACFGSNLGDGKEVGHRSACGGRDVHVSAGSAAVPCADAVHAVGMDSGGIEQFEIQRIAKAWLA